MHEDIKTFSLDGEIADNDNLVEGKERLIEVVEGLMRDHGCVPVLDIDPQFTLNYLPLDEKYEFKITLYGVEVRDGDDAWQTVGLMNGKPIMRYIPKPK